MGIERLVILTERVSIEELSKWWMSTVCQLSPDLIRMASPPPFLFCLSCLIVLKLGMLKRFFWLSQVSVRISMS